VGYALLQRQSLTPRQPIAILENVILPDLVNLLSAYKLDSLWAIDIETNGLDAADPACFPVGIGFADHDGCFYVDLQSADDRARSYIKFYLLNATRLVAFNNFFDGAFLQRWIGLPLQFEGDAYALFKQLSGEGWSGQKWGLGAAITDVLGWPVSSKATLETALKESGLPKSEMWRLPVSVLGPYCAHDAEATYQLWTYLYERANQLP